MSELFIEAGWWEELGEEFSKPYMKKLEHFLSEEVRQGFAVYPPKALIFNALCATPFKAIKVVIIGQDPYHGEGQAHGLSFSVPSGIPAPPSLQNIFKELAADVGLAKPQSGSLAHWAAQGVLLLNATLTVRADSPRSHYGQGWEVFTDAVMAALLRRKDPIVFLLWGKSAQEKCGQQIPEHHKVLIAPHPSPLSASTGFLGCRHFSQANAFLKQCGKTPIEW